MKNRKQSRNSKHGQKKKRVMGSKLPFNNWLIMHQSKQKEEIGNARQTNTGSEIAQQGRRNLSFNHKVKIETRIRINQEKWRMS